MISGLLHSIDSLLAWLDTFTASPWFYLVIFGVALFDSVIPIVPSETTVILGGIAAGRGNLAIPLVIVLAALGALLGDCTAYQIGRRAEGLMTRLFFRGEKGAKRLAGARDAIGKRGGVLLLTGRFIPGGRTAITFACGVTGQPFWQWFVRWDALATVVWAGYAGLLGYFFGEQFKDDHSTAFWLAFGTALGLTAVIEIVRHLRQRRAAARRRAAGVTEPEPEPAAVPASATTTAADAAHSASSDGTDGSDTPDRADGGPGRASGSGRAEGGPDEPDPDATPVPSGDET